MRDFLITIVIFGSIPFILIRPHIGILMWSWVSYMNPHRMTWGFAFDLPVAMIIGVTTIAAWLMSKEERNVTWDSISVLMLLFILWTGVSTAFALVPDEAFEKWQQFNKIILMTFLTMVLMKSEKRLDALIWVTVGSIAYFSTKGGAFVLATAGQYRVFGPPDTFIADNNALALATLMVLPLVRHLAVISTNKWLKRGLNASIVLSLASVIGSYSRGALVAMAVVGLFWWWRSKRRLIVGIVAAVAMMGAIPLIPDKWFDRMDTIRTYEEDGSARGRIEMWVYAVNVALDRPLTGGGFGVFSDPALYDRYNPGITVRNVHSIYFEALGTQGFVGLALFLLLGLAGFRTGSWVIRTAKDRPELYKEYHLATMLQVGIIAYAVAGAFQNLSTYDLYYNMLAMMLLCKGVVLRKIAEIQASEAPGTAPSMAISFRRPDPKALPPVIPASTQPAGAGFRR